MKLKLLSLILAMSVCSLGVAQPRAGTDDYPNRQIRIVVPYPPGAINDNVGRTVGQKLAEVFKQTVVVENRAGAGTIIGSDFVAKSPPDGYTILLSSSANSVNISLQEKLPYDPLKALIPVSLALTTPYVLVVNPNVAAKNFKEFIALAKSSPAGVAYGSGGNGSGSHLVGEMLKQMAQINLLHVPYKGMAPAITDLVGGQVQALFGSYASLASQIKSGRLRAIAVTGKRRLAVLPDVPTVAESGYPDYEGVFWVGFSVPGGTPKPIVDRLSREIGMIMRSAEVRERYSSDAADVIGSSPEELATYFAADTARWAKVIKEGNIKP